LIAYRLCRAAHAATALDGEGARLYGGRWNPKGVRMVYAASSLALGVLESFVHFSSPLLPADYVSVTIEIPDSLPIETWVATTLPADWAQTPAPSSLQAMGKAWIQSGSSAVLRVPSAVVSLEFNVLLNPAHPDSARIRAAPPERFVFDPRLARVAQAPAPRRRRKSP
jgi:RES domain-containing protein